MKRPDRIKTAPDQGYGERVPPGQFVTNKFPVLTYGTEPKIDIKTWRMRVFGLVDREVTLEWSQFAALPWQKVEADFHCVTQWSSLDNTWEGVWLSDLVALAGVSTGAKFVMAHCFGGYSTNLPLDIALEEGLLVHRQDGPAAGQEPRLAAAAGGAQSLRLEEREVGERDRVDGRRRSRLLGVARLPQQRRSLERGTLLARTQPLKMASPDPAIANKSGTGTTYCREEATTYTC